ncbi:glycoside hydrolase family 78 protein [Clostridium felsineum]|uniref:alpha-L-rhamnosidase n=1 Tax=Clostridium felsineum TaxID=36839 RepID=UPI00214DBDAF|nr:alpha-L-rhamnosidase [Clostridium felsineum]MCR3759523.1 glycoside hydrolase family 78 protein [Clostridium felsineum]
MKITNLKTNHIENPIGFDLGKPSFSFIVTETTAKKQVAARIEVSKDDEFNSVIFDSGKSKEIDSLAFQPSIDLEPRTRYYWRVTVWADSGEISTSEVAYFETAKIDESWKGSWITPNLDSDIHPVLIKKFNIEKTIKFARFYVCGLGFYEININDKKCGDEYLSPNLNAYDKWLQYQTYDITNELKLGKNEVEILLGAGMYKGRFGLDRKENIYGDKFALLCEMVINFEDGESLIIKSDESWKVKKSKILASGIYDGEVYDDTFIDSTDYGVNKIALGFDRLKARLSLPVKIKEKLKPVEIIKTPKGETVLDLGQNMVGWLEFKVRAEKGTEINLQYGEILQEGNFYRDNLQSAKAEFKYISDGTEKLVRPHFTYYGFRYVKVSGFEEEINKDDFTGCVIYSDMETTGHIETSNELINRFFLNVLWGQKGNFLDVPTDCPQRDERLGWTGDAQVFSGTASFNMDTFAFFNKYVYDIAREQENRNGLVPNIVPVAGTNVSCSSGWSDVATIIPWTIYVQYGDKKILEQQFESMKAWVDYIKREDDNSFSTRLWTTGFQLGDWLALDGENPESFAGGTEESFIASAYYYYSANIVAKAAKVLKKEDIFKEYKALADEIKGAIREEYFTSTGRLALKNQTAYILAIYMDLVPEGKKDRVVKDLRERLKLDKNYLKTGFIGTPYICRALSKIGCNDLAYKILLNKDYPSWLYAVTMGATTVWERWNSVLPDGKISGTHMNSLNHYAYGSVVEWMYRYMAGINPIEDKPGFRYVKLEPKPHCSFKYVNMSYKSPVGIYETKWEIDNEGKLKFYFNIPFNAEAKVVLPDARFDKVMVNGQKLINGAQEGDNVVVELNSGTYEFCYEPTISYIKYYNIDFSLEELIKNEETKKILEETLPVMLPQGMIEKVGDKSIRELSNMPFFPVSSELLEKLDEKLEKIKVVFE